MSALLWAPWLVLLLLVLLWLLVQDWLEDNHNLGFLQTGRQGGERTIGFHAHRSDKHLCDLHTHRGSPQHQVPVKVMIEDKQYKSNLFGREIRKGIQAPPCCHVGSLASGHMAMLRNLGNRMSD